MIYSDLELHGIYTWLEITKLEIIHAFDSMDESSMKIYYLEHLGSCFKPDHLFYEDKISPSYNTFYQNMKSKCENRKVPALIIAERIVLTPYVDTGIEYDKDDELPGLSLHIEGPETFKQLLYVPIIEDGELNHRIVLRKLYIDKNDLPPPLPKLIDQAEK